VANVYSFLSRDEILAKNIYRKPAAENLVTTVFYVCSGVTRYLVVVECFWKKEIAPLSLALMATSITGFSQTTASSFTIQCCLNMKIVRFSLFPSFLIFKCNFHNRCFWLHCVAEHTCSFSIEITFCTSV